MKHFRDLSAEEQLDYTTRFGGFNDYPPGWRELTEKEFAQSMYFTYHPVVYEHRQMRDLSKPMEPVVSSTLYYMHDGTGFAMVSDFWGGKVKFYTFGCKHEWGDPSAELKKRGIRLHHGEHAHFCTKCGHLSVVDSSD